MAHLRNNKDFSQHVVHRFQKRFCQLRGCLSDLLESSSTFEFF